MKTATRENRFENKPDRKAVETLKEKRAKQKQELDDAKAAVRNKNLLQADYKTRGLDFCYFCGDKFNVGERIPRILIHCGHTFCTQCLSVLHDNFRVRCPICRKLVKQVETVDKLPLNFNILYEIVERDYILRDINFEDEDFQPQALLCEKHDQRVQHFYCSNHLTVFCRECIKEDHTDERCFVVDLYEIEKMRKMHRKNQLMNAKQLEKRKDDADQSCVTQEIPISEIQGDSQWFKKRGEKMLKLKQEKEAQQVEMLEKQKEMLQNLTAAMGAKGGQNMEKLLHHQFGQEMTMEQQKELFKAVQQLKAKPGLKVDPMELIKILMDQKNPKAQHLIEDDSDEEENSESEEFEQEELQYDKIQKKKPQTKKKSGSDGMNASDSDEDLEDDQDSDSEDDSDAQVYLDEEDSDILEPQLINKQPKAQSATLEDKPPVTKSNEVVDAESNEFEQDVL